MKITPREKRRHAAVREKNEGLQTKPKLLNLFVALTTQNSDWLFIFLSPRPVSPFLAWGYFHAHSGFARSTIPEEKWRTTRGLGVIERLVIEPGVACSRRSDGEENAKVKGTRNVFSFFQFSCSRVLNSAGPTIPEPGTWREKSRTKFSVSVFSLAPGLLFDY